MTELEHPDFSALQRTDIKKLILAGVAGSIILFLLYLLASSILPQFSFYLSTVFEIIFVVLIATLGGSYLERQRQYRDPNLSSYTWSNYERAEGLRLNNLAKQVIIDKFGEIPLTMEQTLEFHRIVTRELKEEERPMEIAR